MKTRTLNINQIDVTGDAVLYTCFGLGSCIALFLNDRMTGLAGGAHIPVPEGGDELLRCTGNMLDELLNAFRTKGSTLECLRAKITGGAQVLDSCQGIGARNITAIRKELAGRKIFLAAEDLGGLTPRTARFNTRTGELTITSGETSRLTI